MRTYGQGKNDWNYVRKMDLGVHGSKRPRHKADKVLKVRARQAAKKLAEYKFIA